jgi:2-polyprenyl-3-methyl-5-hydroxy-6-metoxy-1,4-benzoquinol methylase
MEILDTQKIHRKTWEWCFILQALEERGFLQPGKKGLGFACGNEPLPEIMREYGCEILATDGPDPGDWAATGQHNASLPVLDMKEIPSEHDGQFDFVWSTCAMEHLGSLGAGIDFVWNSVKCLKPGGVAIHTTEANVSSEEDTISSGGVVLYRRKDFGYLPDGIDWSLGSDPMDLFVDTPPWNDEHLKIKVGPYVSTCAAIILEKDG